MIHDNDLNFCNWILYHEPFQDSLKYQRKIDLHLRNYNDEKCISQEYSNNNYDNNKMITSQNVSSEAQIKNFFIS